jgi:GNAT superfamily N-acetyltransferase
MTNYTIRALDPGTWDAFAGLAERHGGGGFGCWCTWFHRDKHAAPGARSACTGTAQDVASGSLGSPMCDACPYGSREHLTADEAIARASAPAGPCGLPGRAIKQCLVSEGRAHAALVFDGDVAVAWCQYGSPEELPGIHHRKNYEAGLKKLPDYRLTCFFVDRKYRRKGLAALALRGALELIAQAGGGVVEAYPQDTAGKKVSATFLYSATRSLFEREGFSYDRRKGVNHCVMTKTVPASAGGTHAG